MTFDEIADHEPYQAAVRVGFALTLLSPMFGIAFATHFPVNIETPSTGTIFFVLVLASISCAGSVMQMWVSKETRPILFHASQTSGLRTIKPRCLRPRHPEEGSVVFATPHVALASAFLVDGHDRSWMEVQTIEDVPVAIIHAERDEFVRQDCGGVLYRLPPISFRFDPKHGFKEQEWEWTSKKSVRPISETRIRSALDAMIENGVQVYFVDEQTFRVIRKFPHLARYTLCCWTSENQRRGTNVQKIKV